jgi:hypothetical protein
MTSTEILWPTTVAEPNHGQKGTYADATDVEGE